MSLRDLYSTLIILSLFLMQSCSWVSSKRSLFGSDDPVSTESVSKEQYNQLLKKYDALMKEKKMSMIKYDKMKKSRETRDPFDLSQSNGEIEVKEQLAEDVVGQLSRVNNNLSSTVDVFKRKNNSVSVSNVSPVIVGNEYDSAIVEDHMTKIRKADVLLKQNKIDAALSLIKELEQSPVSQIVVRAKFLLGESLFRQGEYDLAMQIYEEILEKYAFSGLVIKTLGRLIVCSEKLKQTAKQDKYYSILHDFFEESA